jgi:hypothetical protein
MYVRARARMHGQGRVLGWRHEHDNGRVCVIDPAWVARPVPSCGLWEWDSRTHGNARANVRCEHAAHVSELVSLRPHRAGPHSIC